MFEESLKLSFQEIHRVLKPNGLAVIVYAHKSTEGWETLINSLLDSGLIMTSAWPLDTEMKSTATRSRIRYARLLHLHRRPEDGTPAHRFLQRSQRGDDDLTSTPNSSDFGRRG